jgi:hypothetical protein
MADDIETLLDAIRKQWERTATAPVYRESLLRHLQSLASDKNLQPIEPKEVTFPVRVPIAFAVCQCGVREFIVDGSTQECQNCGSLMYRTEVAEYELAPCN